MQITRNEIKTSATVAPGFVDITDEIADVVQASGVTEGRATITRQAAGCALAVNERETGLIADLTATIGRLEDGRKTVGAATLTLPIHKGRLYLGTWQRLLMIELDDPPVERCLAVQVAGE